MNVSSIQITYVGHAGMRLDGDDLRLLMDPWLSAQGAFQAAWYQLPSIEHMDQAHLFDCDWVTVSHEHLDHMDLFVLSRLPPKAHVLIPKYPSQHLRQRLRRAGVDRVVEVPAWHRFYLNDRGDWLTFIPEVSPMCHDAAVLVCAGGASLLHCNDARLTVGQARRAAIEAGGRLDVLAAQMSGASWHPICYEYPAEQMLEISARKRSDKFRAVGRLIRIVKPALAVPFAGPVCFLDRSLQQHNRWIAPPGIFPDQKQATDWLKAYLPGQSVGLWMPGDTFEVLSGRYSPDPHWEGFSYDQLDEYLNRYAQDRRHEIEAVHASYDEPGDDLGDRFADHFARLGELSGYFLERIGMTVRFDVEGHGGGRWDVELGPERVRVDLKGVDREVQYRFRVASRWLAPVIRGELSWEDLLLSLRFSAWRHPDIYNDYFIGLLKHADSEALGAVEAYERSRTTDERIVVEGTDGRYEIGRYCPHAGEDLTVGGVLEGGLLRCLGHNLEFDLATGTCINGRCDPLKTRRLSPREAPFRAPARGLSVEPA